MNDQPQSAFVAFGGGWRFHIMAEIVNFAAVRRRFGRARADRLGDDVAIRIERVAAELRVLGAGRGVIEMWCDGAEPSHLDTLLKRLRRACASPFDIDGEVQPLELIFGAAVAPIARGNDVRVVEEAEAALIEAREAKRAVTHDVAAPEPREVHRLADELSAAIERDELTLFYQPKLHVRQQSVSSAEALIRWRHPTRGIVLPTDFIPAAEECGIIDRLTLWTIRQAIIDQDLLAKADQNLRIFVNIAGQLLADEAFVLAACQLVSGRESAIGFEITETSVIRDPQSAITNLKIFNDIGIHIAIDDYGAGLSSLAYLKQLPARELKIDKMFVTQLTSSNRDPLIVRSTIDLAHALEMEVVAEGVETAAAMALLGVMGCDMVQGFLVCRPVPIDALLAYLMDDQGRAASLDSRETFSRLASVWKRA